MAGGAFGTLTSFHLAEYRVPAARATDQGAPILDDGQRVWVTFRDIVLDEEPFVTIGTELERERPGVVRQGRIGRAEARLFRQRPAVDYAVLWQRRNWAAS